MSTTPSPKGSDMADQATFPPYKQRLVAELVPYVNNARTHSETQVAQIAASIREFGFTNPILVDGENGVIAGHGRLLAARKLGMEVVPVIELAHLTPAQRKAYVIADNQLALNAGWDLDLLRLELGALRDEGFDLDLVGFDVAELDALFAVPTAGRTDPDDVPDVPENPVSMPGDIWLLGRHRLICGDATDGTVVERLLDGVRPHLMVTDPPYGVDYDPAWRNRAGLSGTKRVGKVLNDHRADWREAWALFPGDAFQCHRRTGRVQGCRRPGSHWTSLAVTRRRSRHGVGTDRAPHSATTTGTADTRSAARGQHWFRNRMPCLC